MMPRFALFVCMTSWLALPSNPCFAGEAEPEKPIRGAVLGAQMLFEHGLLDQQASLTTYGGGGFVGYRSDSLIAGLDVTATSSTINLPRTPYIYETRVSYFDVSFYPTLQAAFYQSNGKTVEAFFLAAIYMSRHEEIRRTKNPFSSTDTVTTAYYGRVGYRVGLGARVWFTRHIAASLVGVLGHTVVIDHSRPAVLGVGLLPNVLVMF